MKLLKILLALLLLLGFASPPREAKTPTPKGDKPSLTLPSSSLLHAPFVALEAPVQAPVASRVITQRVLFTNYYIGDGSSGTTTSSGLKISNFQVNGMGWYTYKGKVVVATATTLCLRVKTGPCGNYNTIPDGFMVYDLRSELTIIFKGISYDAIVLDSCGACMHRINGEAYQRYDIFVKDGKFGKTEGQIQVTLK